MPPSNEYNLASTGGGGKLKLKGAKVAGGRVEKKKGKKKRKKVEEPQEKEEGQDQEQERREVRSKSRGLSEEKGAGSQDEAGGSGDGDDDDDEKEKGVVVGKTEAEKRYEEVRKKRVRILTLLIRCYAFKLVSISSTDTVPLDSTRELEKGR